MKKKDRTDANSGEDAEKGFLNLSPSDFQSRVNRGIKRLQNFRNARVMFLRNYVGQYYDKSAGDIGAEPINLTFNAIRVLVPSLVMSFPTHKVTTPWIDYRDYADMMSLTLDWHDRQIKITDVYRRLIVDAVFTLGIMKTYLTQSDTLISVGEEDVDPGTIVTDCVDFDNFLVDPMCEEHLFKDAMFMGHRVCVPRQKLLDDPSYNQELVEMLPRAGSVKTSNSTRARNLSKRRRDQDQDFDLDDDVEVGEIWIPSQNVVVTVPVEGETKYDDYLKVTDYYGPKTGPYTFLSFSPPVPGNPLPVQFAGVWADLHILANRMAKKIIEQADRQKDVIGYKRAAQDDAEELRKAGDGDMIAMDDPTAVQTMHVGGQQQSNELHLSELMQYFNMMAANTEQLGGSQINAKSATAATLLQQNASIGLSDAQDLLYKAAAEEGAKRMWYFHTHPLINLPLTQRQQQPAVMAQGPNGPYMLMPSVMKEVQVILTPEARKGDWTDFSFHVEPESMGHMDGKVRYGQALDFCTKTLPSVASAGAILAQLGIPFSVKAMLINMAKDQGIDWLDEVLYDPEFQQHIQMMMQAGPQPPGAKGSAMTNPNQVMQQVQQNGQLGSLPGATAGPQTQQNQVAQEGAQMGQRLIGKELSHGLFSPRGS